MARNIVITAETSGRMATDTHKRELVPNKRVTASRAHLAEPHGKGDSDGTIHNTWSTASIPRSATSSWFKLANEDATIRSIRRQSNTSIRCFHTRSSIQLQST